MQNASLDYINSVYAPIRQFNAKMRFTINGTTTEYYDDKIMKFNIIEEMNTINNTLPSNEISITMNNQDGDFNALNYQNMYQIIASKPKIEIFLGLVTATTPVEVVEWIQCGTFLLSNWRTGLTNMTVELTGRDYLTLLSDISYQNANNNTYYNLAVDIFTQAGITNYIIDDSLKTMNGNFLERIDCRTALQYIGIASRSAVYQDRQGNMVIKPFQLLDASSNYMTYSGQPQMISGNVTALGTGGGWAYPIVTTGSGARYIDMDVQYEAPDIQLDKSIYQLIINVYKNDLSSYTERVYINSSLTGNNGASFTIDNPLIEDNATADAVADYFFRETNYNAIYKLDWRQNPILECGDIILVEDIYGANKQTRLTSQTFNYEGYLYGNSESRGGI